MLPLAPLQEEGRLGPQRYISRRAGEGHRILGCSFCFNKRGWFLIKCKVQIKLASVGQSRHLELREGGAASLCWGWDTTSLGRGALGTGASHGAAQQCWSLRELL